MNREELLEAIRRAFPDDLFPEDTNPPYEDPFGRRFQQGYPGKRWHEVTREDLRYVASDAWLLDEPTLAHFLPAFMTTDLKGGDWTLQGLSLALQNRGSYLLEHWNHEQLALLLNTILYIYENDDDELNEFVVRLKEILGA